MDTGEVIVHEIEGQRMPMILALLAIRVESLGLLLDLAPGGIARFILKQR